MMGKKEYGMLLPDSVALPGRLAAAKEMSSSSSSESETKVLPWQILRVNGTQVGRRLAGASHWHRDRKHKTGNARIGRSGARVGAGRGRARNRGAGECGRSGVGESVVGDSPGKGKPRSIETDRKREGGEGWRGGDGDVTTRKQWKQRQRQN